MNIGYGDFSFQVSPPCLGVSHFGTVIDFRTAVQIVERFLESGGNFLDTAHVYVAWIENGDGTSERTIGKIIAELGIRDQIILATKGGHSEIPGSYPRDENYLSEEVIRSDLVESLNRLGMNHVDLYYLHRDDPRIPVGGIAELMNEFIRSGLIRAYGVSNWSTQRIFELNAYAEERGLYGIAASQVQGSLAIPGCTDTADPMMRYMTDDDLRTYAEALKGLPIICYSATAGGYFEEAKKNKYGNLYESEQNEARRIRAREYAERLKCTPSQISVAWINNLQLPIIPLISTSQASHLKEAFQALGT